jgi:uncharacterized protein DUF2154
MSERIPGARPAAALALAALLAAGAAEAQTMRSVTSARQLSGERRLDVEVQYGAGHLRVEPARAGSGLLYRLEMRYDQDHFQPLTTYERESGRLRLGLEGRRRRGGDMRVDREHRAEVTLSPQVAMDLELEFGAGEAEVELGGLALENLQLSTGASETTVRFSEPNRVAARRVAIEAGAAEIRVEKLGNARAERFEFEGGLGEAVLDFSGAWSRSATASVEMGIGSLTLRLPRGLGVRITKDSFLTSFDAPGMTKRGNAWYSRDYEDARHKLDLSIDAAIGSIEIDWIDG